MLKIGESPVLLFFFSKICMSGCFRHTLAIGISNPFKTKKSAHMKSSAQSSFNISVSQESSGKSAQSQSPYLKAILSGKLMAARNEQYYESNNSDRAAASRYIKESKLSNKY